MTGIRCGVSSTASVRRSQTLGGIGVMAMALLIHAVQAPETRAQGAEPAWEDIIEEFLKTPEGFEH